MTPRFSRTGATMAVALAASLLATAAFAQTPPPAQQQAPSQSQAAPGPSNLGPTPTAAELQHFAHAAEDVEGIKQAAQPGIAAAKSTDARTKLQKSAEQKMEAAVRSHHLSVQRYEQIAMVVQTNSTIRNKVLKLMAKPAKS